MPLTRRRRPTRSFFIAIDRNGNGMLMAVGGTREPLPPSFISRNKRGRLIAHNRIRRSPEKSVSRAAREVFTREYRALARARGRIVELVNSKHSAIGAVITQLETRRWWIEMISHPDRARISRARRALVSLPSAFCKPVFSQNEDDPPRSSP